MEVTTTKCDVCGKTETSGDYNGPKGWYTIRRKTDKDKDFWKQGRDVCTACVAKVGLDRGLRELKPVGAVG